MLKELRDYQLDTVNKIKKRLKEVSHPILITMSVGAGKSLCISAILEWIQKNNYRGLCLTFNSTLIQQNYNTHKAQGMDAGIYSSALNSKEVSKQIIFGSPQSVCQAIKNQNGIWNQKFNIIIVDECHQINPKDESTMLRRIINHYSFMAQQERFNFRVLGFTGTPFRDKNESIHGEHAFFKEELVNISTSYLIERGFLTKPYFGMTHTKSFDFSKVKIENNGKFNQSQLQTVINDNIRLTGEIMLELQQLECNGMFIFCSTVPHCFEALRSLPADKSAAIVGSTSHKERQEILAKAQTGEIKYLVSVSILMVGVDVPFYNYCCWLRPTESLILFTQGIGRVLRLHPAKKKAIILDFAKNLDRHQDIDNPIINDAIQPREDNEQEFIIMCYTCETLNSLASRRCRGIHNGARCDHFFQFKSCPNCSEQNDSCSRSCRGCGHELIDPNAKLTRIKPEQFELIVKEARYWVHNTDGFPVINVHYQTNDEGVFECHYVKTEKSKNIFYANFVRKHIPNPSEYYMRLLSFVAVNEMITTIKIRTPHTLICKKNEYGRYEIIKKLFKTIEVLDV